ncbi:DUF6716 putative glycosyltransferase [Demequina sp. NBRC 110055]|uniref:DUF6716 putative glycosyltransferase n=1 Tax=Demequina sp. NBRC 110055 TaxID=1570344 RepID=UPI000A057132|nr:DUF6716 putative glycosyltransferase [Demequina sp. NBRC 110055]
MKALVVADSDSYLKWAVSRALDLWPAWDVEVVVVANAVTPSPRQRHDAVAGRWRDVEVVSVADVGRIIAGGIDLVLLACRGPLISHLFSTVLADAAHRPVVAAGIPGLWFPPTERGLAFRADVDVMVVHSEREREACQERVTEGSQRWGLASLAAATGYAEPLPDRHVREGALVFAPQALVPRTVADRRRLLDGLIDAARAHPEVAVVVKLRGGDDEAQTHREFASFPHLAEDAGPLPANLQFARGALADHLVHARGLVTVSSTAALEALAAGVPVLIVGDFGVDEENLNLVFAGSGLVGTLDDLRALRFFEPRRDWLAANYFHGAQASDWVAHVEALAANPAVLARLRAARPAPQRERGPRAGLGRARRRAQALGAADVWWRRAAMRSLGAAVAVARRRPRSRDTTPSS